MKRPFTFTNTLFCVVSGFRRKVDESCPLLDYYVAGNDHSLPTFADDPSSRILDP